MRNKQDYSLWYGKIDNSVLAEKILKSTFILMISVYSLSFLMLSVVGSYSGWIDLLISGLASFWLWKRKSITAGIILVVLGGIALLITASNKIFGGGGSNIYMALLTLWFSIRGLKAAQWFSKNKSAK